MKALTSRQSQVLRFIDDHTRRSGFPPSVRDIGDRFGLNPATVHDHIKALERKGRLIRQPHRSRSLVVVKEESSRIDATTANETVAIPVVGGVAAGTPIVADENIEDRVRFPRGWARAGSFLLRVEGDSMEGAHILDGDYVLVAPSPTASNGEIVVALIEDEATVKRFYRKAHGVELRPENAAYQSIKLHESDGKRFAIVGKVAGVLRI